MVTARQLKANCVYCLISVATACGSPEPNKTSVQYRFDRTSSEQTEDSLNATSVKRKSTQKTRKTKADESVSDSQPDTVTKAIAPSSTGTGNPTTPANGTVPPSPTSPTAPGQGSGDPAIADCHKGDEFTCKVEFEIVRLTNEKRSGMSPLRHDKNLAYISRDWSRQQSQVGAISHTGFPGARVSAYQQEFGSGTQINAENVAMFSGGGSSPQEVAQKFVEMWYNSPGHRANMLGPYQRLGAGVYRGARGFYGTQIFGN